jgi:hypothetical protein
VIPFLSGEFAIEGTGAADEPLVGAALAARSQQVLPDFRCFGVAPVGSIFPGFVREGFFVPEDFQREDLVSDDARSAQGIAQQHFLSLCFTETFP